MGPLEVHRAVFPYRPERLRACRPAEVMANVQRVRMQPNLTASVIASAFMQACRSDNTWSAYDADAYFNISWLPGTLNGGADCSQMSRFGPPFLACPAHAVPVHSIRNNPRAGCGSGRRLYEGEGKYAQLGDGGKMVCDAGALFSDGNCLVVSVGINANTEFEEALHRAHPNCDVVGYDGTLNAAKKARARTRTPFLRLHAQNFGPAIANEYSGRAVRLLKIDCDGCEFGALPAWINSVCTDQIVVEVHKSLRQTPWTRVRNVHMLMTALDKLYRIFYLEPNPPFPWLNTEFALIRRTPCPR